MSEVQETQEIRGVGFAVAAFNDEDAGKQALKAMKQAKKEGQFYYEAAAVVRKESDGDVHYHETGDMSTGRGAGIGALVGGVIGILGGPVGVAAGAGIGAVVGGVAAHPDKGFNNKNLKQLGAALKPGTSAVLAITSKEFLKAYRKEVSQDDTWAILTIIANRIATRQAEGKDIMIGVALSDEAFVVGELAADDQVAELIGAAVTAEGVAVGKAVATEDAAGYHVEVATDEAVYTETAVADDEVAAVVDTVTNDEGTYAEGVAVTDEGVVTGQAVIPATEDEVDNPETDKDTTEVDEGESTSKT